MERLLGNYPRSLPSGTSYPEKKAEKFYASTRWKELAILVKASEPFCRLCKEPAVCVDHISGEISDNTRCNLQPLCQSCHSWKTNRFDKRERLKNVRCFTSFLARAESYRLAPSLYPMGYCSRIQHEFDLLSSLCWCLVVGDYVGAIEETYWQTLEPVHKGDARFGKLMANVKSLQHLSLQDYRTGFHRLCSELRYEPHYIARYALVRAAYSEYIYDNGVL